MLNAQSFQNLESKFSLIFDSDFIAFKISPAISFQTLEI